MMTQISTFLGEVGWMASALFFAVFIITTIFNTLQDR
jgi:hypothetical protein